MTSQAFPPFRLINDAVRATCIQAVMRAPEGWHCIIRPATRTLDQNARLHAILADIAKSGKIHHEGRRFTVDDLKTLFVSAWMIENKMPSDIVPGFNGEVVQLRRSTTTFTKAELSSLMDYIESECARRGIPLTDRAPMGDYPEFDRATKPRHSWLRRAGVLVLVLIGGIFYDLPEVCAGSVLATKASFAPAPLAILVGDETHKESSERDCRGIGVGLKASSKTELCSIVGNIFVNGAVAACELHPGNVFDLEGWGRPNEFAKDDRASNLCDFRDPDAAIYVNESEKSFLVSGQSMDATNPNSRAMRGVESLSDQSDLLFARRVQAIGGNSEPNGSHSQDASEKHQPKRILRKEAVGFFFFFCGFSFGGLLFGLGVLLVRWRVAKI